MRVISRKALREFAERHEQAKGSLDAWYHTARHATWGSLVDVKAVYSHADLVGELTVFNISGNRYRLITYINYSSQKIFIKTVLTHAEYDKGEWK
jgi:mRNA interferase HigB